MSLPNYITEFLNTYDGFSIAPSSNDFTVLKGKFSFKRTYNGENEIEDHYDIAIKVPKDFPRSVPDVEETSGKIPRNGLYHINPDDTFCLGSPLRQLLVLSRNPSLLEFVELLLVPYLYAVSYKLKNGGEFIFGELMHGLEGELSDYETLFKVRNKPAVMKCLHALSTKKRVANKKICPCGCGYRLRSCELHNRLNSLRKIVTRSYFRKLTNRLHIPNNNYESTRM